MTYLCKAQIVLGSGNFFYIKIEIKYPAGQNLEIITFRYLKTLVFYIFLKISKHYLMFLHLKSIIIIDIYPPSLWLSHFVPPYTLIPSFILEKSTWPQNFLEVSSDSPTVVLGGRYDAMTSWFHLVCMAP